MKTSSLPGSQLVLGHTSVCWGPLSVSADHLATAHRCDGNTYEIETSAQESVLNRRAEKAAALGGHDRPSAVEALPGGVGPIITP